jgi:hypothetical protein
VGVNVASGGVCPGGCSIRPPPTCCFSDGDCSGRDSECIGEVCAFDGAGTCHGPPPAGGCWEDDDCRDGRSCVGARVCPCGAFCILPDAPGTCGALTP